MPPFQNVPDPEFFCPLPACQELLEKLLYVVHGNRGGALVTGEIGCGKSTLSRVFIVELEEGQHDIGLVISPSVAPEELLYDIARQLGLSPPSANRAALLRALNDHILANAQAGRTAVLIVDEAHTIRDDTIFEDLRLLMNFQLNHRQALAVILFGAPELKDTVARHAALLQRLAVRLHLSPLSEEEAAAYVDFRVKRAGGTGRIFTDEAIRAISRAAGGVPRTINDICDLCLFEGAKRKAKQVDSALVKAALAYV